MSRDERAAGGRWHRFLFSIMGPAQVGPYDTGPPAADSSSCPKCGTAWNDHEVVRTATRAYSRCPSA